MADREAFLLYRTQCKSLMKLTPEMRGEILGGIIQYFFDGIEPEFPDLVLEVLFDQIRDQLDRDGQKYTQRCERNKQIAIEREKKRRERSDTNVHERERTCTEGTDKEKEKEKDKEKETDKDKDKDTDTDATAKKHKHGEYNNVLLTDAELKKLREKFPTDYGQRIDRLSEYMASTGRSYKNHCITILSWARRDGGKGEEIDRQQRESYKDEFNLLS